MSEYCFSEMYAKWKERDTENNFEEWIEDWKRYPALAYKTMSMDEKIDFMYGVQKEFIATFDENGNDTMNTLRDMRNIQAELCEHPEWFEMKDLKRILEIVDDDCFELVWQQFLTKIIYNVILYNGEKGMKYYFENLHVISEHGYLHGCRFVIRGLLEDEQGRLLLKKVFPEQGKEIQEEVLQIMNDKRFQNTLQELSEILLEKQ